MNQIELMNELERKEKEFIEMMEFKDKQMKKMEKKYKKQIEKLEDRKKKADDFNRLQFNTLANKRKELEKEIELFEKDEREMEKQIREKDEIIDRQAQELNYYEGLEKWWKGLVEKELMPKWKCVANYMRDTHGFGVEKDSPITKKQIRAKCRQLYGVDWWKDERKNDRIETAKDSLRSLRYGRPCDEEISN
tara:strand:- start:251 stop:826 length:576 start_codon:yes stop_codon:yes gene_type:complete